MTRKDYELIARTFRGAAISAESIADNYQRAAVITSLGLTACKLADELKHDNPRFDRSRFLKACGVGQEG